MLETAGTRTRDLSVRLLGALEVLVDGRPVRLTAGRLRSLLAVLALAAGEAVPVDRLAEAMWGEEPPVDARRTVQVYVARLRRALGGEFIQTTDAGYRLRVEPDRVDAVAMLRLFDAASSASDVATERAILAQALDLWGGIPLQGLQSSQLVELEADRLTEQYLAGLERRIDLDLARSSGGELVAELRELTAQHPLRERFWCQLMVALYRCGRQADALDTYRRLYRLLADELGIAPSPAAREVQRRILAADPTLGGEDPRSGPDRALGRPGPRPDRGPNGNALEVVAADAERGTVELAYNATESVANPVGQVLAAFVSAMLADPGTLEPHQVHSTLELKTTFLRPVPPGRLIGRGLVLRQVADVTFLEASLADANGATVATASATMVTRARPSAARSRGSTTRRRAASHPH